MAALRVLALIAPALASCCSAACLLVWLAGAAMVCSSGGSVAVVAAAAEEAASLAAACRQASVSRNLHDKILAMSLPILSAFIDIAAIRIMDSNCPFYRCMLPHACVLASSLKACTEQRSACFDGSMSMHLSEDKLLTGRSCPAVGLPRCQQSCLGCCLILPFLGEPSPRLPKQRTAA